MPVPCPFCNVPSDLLLELKPYRDEMSITERVIFDYLWRRSPGYVSTEEMMERIEASIGGVTLASMRTLMTRIRKRLPDWVRIEARFNAQGGYRLVSDRFNRTKMFT